MSSEHGNDSGSEDSGSDDSRFSTAAPVSAPKQPERSRKKDKKRAGNRSIHDDFDDGEFVFKDRECDLSKSDDGGTLGAGLEKYLNEMPNPSGGQGPMKKKKKETRQQAGGGNVRRSAGHGRGGRSRSTNAGRTQRQGDGYSSFLDQAEDERARDMGTAGQNISKPFSLTGSPTAQTSNERAATNKKVGKGKDRGHKAPPGQGWTSSRNTDQELKLGMVGKGKTPSTTTRRSKDKRALDLSKSNAGHGQLEAGPMIDMTSHSDNDDDANVEGGSSRKRSPSPVLRDAGSDDETYGVADVFSPGSGRKSSKKRNGVNWNLDSDDSDHGGFSSSDSGEDFAEASRKDEQCNGKRKKKARTSNKNGSSKPITITEDDEETSATQGSVLSKMAVTVKNAFRASGLGYKRGKDEQGSSGESNKKNKIKPGCTFSQFQGQEDEILSFSDSQEEKKGRAKQAGPDVRSSGKKAGQSKSNGIDPSGFHAKKSKSNSRTLESYLTSDKKSKKASQYGGSGSISPKKRPPPRRCKRKRKNEVITIDDSSSDDDAALSDDQYLDELEQAKQNSLNETPSKPRAVGGRFTIEAARVAIGKKVFSHQCQLQMQLGSRKPFLRVSYGRDGETNGSRKNVHTILEDSILELRYFLAEQDEESDGEESGRTTASSGGDGLSFLAMRIAPTKDNDLQKFSNAYLQNSDEDDNEKRYIVVELRSDDEFVVALDGKLRRHPVFGGYFSEESRLDRDQAKKYTIALIEDDLKDKQKRASMPGKRKTRSSSRAAKAKSDSEDNKIHLVYPFDAEQDFLENACKDLTELGGMLPVVSEDGANLEWVAPSTDKNGENSSSSMAAAASASDDNGEGTSASVASATSKATARTHYLTIRQDEVERLEPGEFLNDTLIDFFMRWIWRNDDPESSPVHFFTSHFFTTLDDEGPEAVSSWTAKKNIDIFKKRFIFIPINESLHWSLCVVVNPGCIENEFEDEENQSDDQDFPFILFLDSLKAHRKVKVANKVRRWLNYEAKRLGKFKETFEMNPQPFNKKTMEVFDPRVPYQDNSWDCGVFVCRYAYGLYLMRNKRITYRTAGVEDEPPYLRDLITSSPGFDFDMEDIARVREELKKLIQNLSSGYLEVKAKEDAERDEKRRAKKRKLLADATAEASTADAKDCEETKGDEEKKPEEINAEAKGGAVDQDVDGAEV